MHCRPYDPDADRVRLWRTKRAFERELAARTGGVAKRAAYEAKLTEAYHERYLGWVGRCVAESADCVTVTADAGDEPGRPRIGGYAFVLPESLALVWDTAVLNELYVVPECRGTGVAADLLETALSTARAQDLPLDRLMLDVAPANRRRERSTGATASRRGPSWSHGSYSGGSATRGRPMRRHRWRRTRRGRRRP